MTDTAKGVAMLPETDSFLSDPFPPENGDEANSVRILPDDLPDLDSDFGQPADFFTTPDGQRLPIIDQSPINLTEAEEAAGVTPASVNGNGKKKKGRAAKVISPTGKPAITKAEALATKKAADKKIKEAEAARKKAEAEAAKVIADAAKQEAKELRDAEKNTRKPLSLFAEPEEGNEQIALAVTGIASLIDATRQSTLGMLAEKIDSATVEQLIELDHIASGAEHIGLQATLMVRYALTQRADKAAGKSTALSSGVVDDARKGRVMDGFLREIADKIGISYRQLTQEAQIYRRFFINGPGSLDYSGSPVTREMIENTVAILGAKAFYRAALSYAPNPVAALLIMSDKKAANAAYGKRDAEMDVDLLIAGKDPFAPPEVQEDGQAAGSGEGTRRRVTVPGLVFNTSDISPDAAYMITSLYEAAKAARKDNITRYVRRDSNRAWGVSRELGKCDPGQRPFVEFAVDRDSVTPVTVTPDS